MEYLRLNRAMKVRASDILYVRKVRDIEALGIDRDGPINAPKNAAVIVLRDKKAARIVSSVSFETVMERMGFVDIGENRFVPAQNIEELNGSPAEFEGKRFRVVWLKGFDGALSSSLLLHELEGRLADALLKQERLDDNAAKAERVKQRLLRRVPMARVPVMSSMPVGVGDFGFDMAA